MKVTGREQGVAVDKYILTQSVQCVPAGPDDTCGEDVPTITIAPGTCPKKSEGDADCNGRIDLVDLVCFVGELKKNKPHNCKSSDHVQDGIIDSADYSKWRNSYLRDN